MFPLLVACFANAACAARDSDSEARSDARRVAPKPEKFVGQSALPLNRRFANLDTYLAYLKTVSGPSDGPWYREIRPGIYQLETPLRRRIVAEGEREVDAKRTFTREELLEKFGFSK